MPNRTLLLTLLALLICTAPSRPVAAQEGPTTMFLLDASGSMWARFNTETEKRAKIDVLRDLLKSVVTSAAANNRIGLTTYGHRRRGDCSDVEVVAPPNVDRTVIMEAIDKLNPKGKGPLSDALRQAAAATGQNKQAAIVAVTDGADNCRQDACATAAAIAKTSPGLAVHVVSVGVDPIDHPRLQCIAKETGGKFYDARDPVGLAAAISEAAGLVGNNDAVIETADIEAPTPAQLAGASLRANLALAPKTPPLKMAAHWRIEKTGSEQPPRLIEAAQIAENLPPGTYDVEARVGEFSAHSQVEIAEGKPQTLALSLDAARLKVNVKNREPEAGGGAPLVTITKRGGAGDGATIWLGRQNSYDALLPPATYAVSVVDGQTRQEREVSLKLGSETATEFTLGTGHLILAALTRHDGQMLSDVTFSVAIDDPESPDGRRELLRSRAPEPDFTLLPGTYYVSAKSGNAEVSRRIALSAGDTVNTELIVPAVPIKVRTETCNGAVTPNLGLVYRVLALDNGESREIARSTRTEYSDTLNAGKYRVIASLEDHAVSAAQDLLLESGKPADITLQIDCGEIGFKPPALAGAVVPGEAFWQVKDPTGRAVWHTTAAEPKVLLAPGRYTVRVEVRDRTAEAAFEVKSGDRRLVELGSK